MTRRRSIIGFSEMEDVLGLRDRDRGAGDEDSGALARDEPIPCGILHRTSRTTVTGSFARPYKPPSLALDRCQQRLGRGAEQEVAAQIDDQQTVGAVRGEKA